MSSSALIVPCFNESGRLNVKSFSDFLKNNIDIDLYLIDDGSTDDTYKIINNIRHNHQNCFSFRNENNLGKANIIRLGVKNALRKKDYEYIGYLDADLSTPLDEMKKFIKKLKYNKKLFMVMGCRVQRSGANIQRDDYRHYFSRIFVTVVNNYLEISFYDTQAGAKLFRSSIAKKIFKNEFITSWLFDIEIILMLKKIYKQNIYEFIYEYPLESWIEKGESKVKLIDIIKIPILLRKIKKEYLLF